MKISKSILSPGRSSRDPPISLSTSLSRRLRTNGSMKGGQASPMFPTGGKKNRCAFENPEPSSPKVTCIGQVRVKSKKKKQQGKKLRSLSRRHSTGQVSFRRLEQAGNGFSQSPSYLQSQRSNVSSIQESMMPQRNQKWVHLPLTICEALRTIGSSCFSTSERKKEERVAARSGEGNAGQSSRGAVFRWLVAVQDGEGGGKGGRDIELVVGGVDEEREVRKSRRRRHVFDDLEIVDNIIHLKDEGGGDEEEEGKISICIPPKNALLLMRCRSDPVQMEALTSKYCESTAPIKDDIDEDEEVEVLAEKIDDENEFKDFEVEEKEEKSLILDEEQEKIVVEEFNLDIERENQEGKLEVNEDVEEEIEEEIEAVEEVIDDKSMFLDCLFEEFADEQVIMHNVQDPIQEEEEKETHAETTMEDNGEDGPQDQNFEDATELLISETTKLQEESVEDESKERESVSQMLVRESELEVKAEKEKRVAAAAAAALPDCLLLMMCEPKLSMEVSKETWVCSTDFIRWQQQPQRKKPATVKPIDGEDDESNKKSVVESNNNNNLPPAVMAYRERNPVLYQPPRSSCCLPAPAVATMIEQKLVGCEPFVLTRCKSEPMRNASSKLVPETCFWKNRKLEPLRRAAYGVSAAGLGF